MVQKLEKGGRVQRCRVRGPSTNAVEDMTLMKSCIVRPDLVPRFRLPKIPVTANRNLQTVRMFWAAEF